MDALILSAGFGTRLGSLTVDTPKPMLKIGNQPLLKINLDKVTSLNVQRIFINTHYKGEVISSYIQEKFDLKNKLVLLHEPELLGTAGTVQSLVNLHDVNNLIVMHGDNFFEDDLNKMLEAFNSLPDFFWGTVGYFRTNEPENFGIFELDEHNTVISFHEKNANAVGGIANSAIYMFNSKGLKNFAQLEIEKPDISLDVLPRLVGRIKAVELDGIFLDIGTPDNLQKANNFSNRKIN
jgi:mannose-1-phosphate guanylyltransferase